MFKALAAIQSKKFLQRIQKSALLLLIKFLTLVGIRLIKGRHQILTLVGIRLIKGRSQIKALTATLIKKYMKVLLDISLFTLINALKKRHLQLLYNKN